MISSMMFTLVRVLQILLLLPMVGMLGYFIDPYVQNKTTAPDWLMLMFIISVIGAAWCILTLFQFHRSYIHSLFVLVIDIAFFACFIAGVVLMDFVKDYDCVDASVPVGVQIGDNNYSAGDRWSFSAKKNCIMLKVSWVFGIINIILFFVTAVFAWQLHRRSYDRASAPVAKETRRRRRWV